MPCGSCETRRRPAIAATVLEFDDTLFADFGAVLAAASQVESNMAITFDAVNTVTLKNVVLTNLHANVLVA